MRPGACATCGAAFDRLGPGHRYCSARCTPPRPASGAGKGWAKGRETAERQLCEVCGATFYAPPVQIRRGGGRFCSNQCRGRYVAHHPEAFPQTTGRRGAGGKRADLGGVYFRSSWEANYARYLTWLQAQGVIRSWEFEPETFEFPIRKGQRFYVPDFRVTEADGSVSYHEVKGWMDPRSATKLRRMAKYHPEVRIVLIGKDEYRAIARSMSRMLPGWEGGRARND